MADVLKFEPLTGSVDVGFLELREEEARGVQALGRPVPIRGGFTGAAGATRRRRSAWRPTRSRAGVVGAAVALRRAGHAAQREHARGLQGDGQGGGARARGAALWEAITSGRAYDEPALLLRFALLSFADLKTHKLLLVAFPSLALNPPPRADAPAALADVLDGADPQLREGYAAPRAADGGAPPSSPSAAPAAARPWPSARSPFASGRRRPTPPSRRRGVAGVARGERPAPPPPRGGRPQPPRPRRPAAADGRLQGHRPLLRERRPAPPSTRHRAPSSSSTSRCRRRRRAAKCGGLGERGGKLARDDGPARGRCDRRRWRRRRWTSTCS